MDAMAHKRKGGGAVHMAGCVTDAEQWHQKKQHKDPICLSCAATPGGKSSEADHLDLKHSLHDATHTHLYISK